MTNNKNTLFRCFLERSHFFDMKKFIILLTVVSIVMPSCVFAEVETTAKATILVEQETGTVLDEKNPDDELPIASVTKIMTLLLIMEEIDSGRMTLADEVTVSDYAMSMGGSTMFLETGEVLTVNDMLKGIAVASANDGCVAMAEHISGSESAFVDKMNDRAGELGMEHTHFVNTNGLDTDGHYSSARDVSIMARELTKHKKIFDYTTIWTDSLRDGKFQLANTNKLIRFYQGATGMKTGSTDNAGCCLCATATRNGNSYIAVVLGAPCSKDRFADARALLDFAFANYKTVHPISKGESVGKIKVKKGVSDTVDAVSADDFCAVLTKENKGKIEIKTVIPESLTAPVSADEKIGEAEFFIDGESIGKVDLLTKADVGKKSIFEMIGDILKSLIGA